MPITKSPRKTPDQKRGQQPKSDTARKMRVVRKGRIEDSSGSERDWTDGEKDTEEEEGLKRIEKLLMGFWEDIDKRPPDMKESGGQVRREGEGYTDEEGWWAREDTDEEEIEEYARKRVKQKSPREKGRKEEGRERIEKLTIGLGLREETEKRLQDMKESDDQLRRVVAQVKKKWERWEKAWRPEKEAVWRKLEDIEKAQKAREENRREEMDRLERRMEKLENRERDDGGREAKGDEGRETRGRNHNEKEEKVKRAVKRGREEARKGRERERRKRNVVVRRMETGRDNARKEVEKLMKVIGVNVQMLEVKGVGAGERGGSGVCIVKLGSEEERREVMEKKKRLRGRRERIGQRPVLGGKEEEMVSGAESMGGEKKGKYCKDGERQDMGQWRFMDMG